MIPRIITAILIASTLVIIGYNINNVNFFTGAVCGVFVSISLIAITKHFMK